MRNRDRIGNSSGLRAARRLTALVGFGLAVSSLGAGCSNNGGIGDGVIDDGTLPLAGSPSAGGQTGSRAGSPSSLGGSGGSAGSFAGSGGLGGNAGSSGSGGTSGAGGHGGSAGSAGSTGKSGAGGMSAGGMSAGGMGATTGTSGSTGMSGGGSGGSGGSACVSTTCGNGTVEGCEACDVLAVTGGGGGPQGGTGGGTANPNYGATCSSDCAYKVSNQACVDCENAGDCDVSVQNCVLPFHAAPFDAQQSTQCFAVMHCILESGCFKGADSAHTLGSCYCGSLTTTQCGAAPFDLTAAGAPNGPCAAVIQAGMTGFTSNTAILGGLTASAKPAGAAMQRLNCQKIDNNAACITACGLSAFP